MTAEAELPAALAPLAWLVGRWAGVGVGGYPTIPSFQYAQEVEWSVAGPAVLAYQSSAWSVEVDRPLAREAGFWRPLPGGELEVVLAHPTGIVEVHFGRIVGHRIEMATDVVARTPSAKDVAKDSRLYALVEEDLMYAVDLQAMGQPDLSPHLSARLHRLPANGA